jgi:hypothetical protein
MPMLPYAVVVLKATGVMTTSPAAHYTER